MEINDLIAEVSLYIESDEARGEVFLPDVSADLCNDLRAAYSDMAKKIERLEEDAATLATMSIFCEDCGAEYPLTGGRWSAEIVCDKCGSDAYNVQHPKYHGAIAEVERMHASVRALAEDNAGFFDGWLVDRDGNKIETVESFLSPSTHTPEG